MSSQLDSFISGATRMPALPHALDRLLGALGGPNASADDLSEIIASDTTLSAKVLRMSNSAFYGRMERVTSIPQATVRLGHKTIKSLVLTIWTQTFRSMPFAESDLKFVSELLTHGTSTAVAANMLMLRLRRDLAEDAYIAGLLHDIGRLALICQLGGNYRQEIVTPATDQSRDIMELETAVLGFDHCVLGARLMQSWNLPTLCVNASAGHHRDTVTPEEDPVLAVVMLADDLSTRAGHNVVECAVRKNWDDLLPFFNVTDLPAFMEECEARLRSITEALEEQ